jgi:hypothetical protein
MFMPSMPASRGRTVAIGPGRMAPAHCRHGWSVVVRTRSRRVPSGSLASTFVSAWASAEPNISPGGPPPSFTWLRAEQTISPAGVETQAPTATFPVRSASHAWRNASCHGLSSPARICAAAADEAAGSRSTA